MQARIRVVWDCVAVLTADKLALVADAAAFAAAGPSQQATRHARRVYVGGLPPTANEQNIATFFSNALAAVGGTTAGPGESLHILLMLRLTALSCRLLPGSFSGQVVSFMSALLAHDVQRHWISPTSID